MVLYRTRYGDEDLWVRPYTMFFENVIIDEKEVPRFKFIGDANV